MKVKAIVLVFSICFFIAGCGYDTKPVSKSTVYPKQYPAKNPKQKREQIRNVVHKQQGRVYVADQAPRNIIFERSVTVPAKKHTWVLPQNDAKYKNASNTML